MLSVFFFFNDTATTEIYTLSLHDALPISVRRSTDTCDAAPRRSRRPGHLPRRSRDRKSTRLNSSHQIISYAVFCLKKKKDDRDLQRQSCVHNTHAPQSADEVQVDDIAAEL